MDFLTAVSAIVYLVLDRVTHSRWTSAFIAISFRLFYSLLFYIAKTNIRRSSASRRGQIISQVKAEQEAFETQERLSPKSEDADWENVENHSAATAKNGSSETHEDTWDGIVGFLHPFSNAGGGGERVLWAAVKATQERWPNSICVIYTGDQDASKDTILQRAKSRFNIHLHAPKVVFLYLGTRDMVLGSTWPRFTLLGQSYGSLLMAHDALKLLVPDIFIDTMGYAFSIAFCKYFFPEIPTGAYVHYPFIGTHMVKSLTEDSGQGVNAGAGKGLRGLAKRLYWHSLVGLYTLAGRSVDIVMTNSSWTKSHMQNLWGPNRTKREKHRIEVVFPSVAVEEVIDAIPLEDSGAIPRQKILIYIAQFRAEKNHDLILQAFARMLKSYSTTATNGARLVLIGSVRDNEDETLVYKLRLQSRELKVEDAVEFRTKDVSWSEILEWLQKSWVGVNGMWCEHFGMGVVEYQAAGLISVVNDSGGPKADIVVDYDGGPTGKSSPCSMLRDESLLLRLSHLHVVTAQPVRV